MKQTLLQTELKNKIKSQRKKTAIKSLQHTFKYLMVLFFLFFSFNTANANTYIVTNTGDNSGVDPAFNAGTGTLRQAIIDANTNGGADNINFNISGTGPFTITLSSLLPFITDPTTINGYSQPGAIQGAIGSRTIMIAINGNDLSGTSGFIRFTPTADGSSLSGFSIYNTGSEALTISENCNNIHIWGNYIGIMPDGTSPTAANFNSNDGILLGDNSAGAPTGSFTNIFIGTDGNGINDANEGNVISNNSNPTLGGDGIQVGSNVVTYTYSNVRISGNYIGVEANGVTPAPNGANVSPASSATYGQDGIYTQSASNLQIGSNADGVSDILERNIISGNWGHGIEMLGTTSSIAIAGNYIGTDKTGAIAVSNGKLGTVVFPYSGVQITGISGNATNVVIGFNDATMLAANAAAARNVISGNFQHGIQLFTISGAGNKIAGNYIGVNATGNTALGNGQMNSNNAVAATLAMGIDMTAAANVLIGTDADADDDVLERNVISGNISARGVYIRNLSTGNIVAGNYIGVGADGTTAIGNGFSGVHIDASNNNRIGSNDDNINDTVEGNIIANNANSLNSITTTSDGVRVTLNGVNNSVQNRISRNIFYRNKENAIDLANNNVSVNDGTTASGQPNLLLDYPVFTAYSISGSTMTVSGYVGACNGTETVAGTTIGGTLTVQVYKVADDGDQTGAITGNSCIRKVGHGEGVQYLGSINVTGGQFTNATLTLAAGATFTGSDKVTGITIDAAGNTSEFGVDVAPVAYIYVHKKSLNEVNKDFSFSVTSATTGATSVPNFTLNDEPTQVSAFYDIGASENGRLWASTDGGFLYYRNANSTVWVNTGIGAVTKVDGGPNGTCYYLNGLSGTVYSYDGVNPQVAISAAGQFYNAGSSNDIGTGWTGTPTSTIVAGSAAVYAVKDDGNIYKWNGPGTTTWGIYATIGGSQYRIDVNPVNGNVYEGGNIGTVRTINEITPAATPVITSLGSPVADNSAYRDIAVTQNGEIYAVAYNDIAPDGWFVHKFVSGTTWTRELGSFDASNITGGVSNTLWSTMNSGGQNGGSGWAPAAGPYPFYNIFSRAFDGTAVTYIDDERVRTTTGNSELIPVAPGTYTITEAAAAGWDLQKILLYDPTNNSTSNQVAGTATINVANGEVVHVVYQNGELNPVVMTNNCSAAYLETFGVGTSVGTATTSGSFGLPVAGQTSYHYLAGNAPGEDGYYKIVNRANPDFNGWDGAAGIVDHTPGDGALGYMYAVNAGFDKGEFFRRRFTGVIPGATYNFTAWIVDLTASAPTNPNVSFSVYDHTTQALLGTYNTGELTSTVEPDSWQKYGFSFVASAADIDLVIGNNGFGGNGNDLAIDDISFSLIPSASPVTTITHSGCGTLGNITVTSPTGTSFEYSKDGVAWQSSASFTNLTPGIYTTYARFVGTVSCITSKTDTVKAAICGNVYNDVNGLTDNTVNGIGTNVGGTLIAVIYDNTTGKIVDTAYVTSSGAYTLHAATGDNYSVYLTSTPATIGQTAIPIVTMPTGWVKTGENIGAGAGSILPTDGILIIGTLSNSIININFGIEQPPVTLADQSLNNVTGTPVTINPLTNDTDAASGILDPTTVSLVAPTGATGVVTDAHGDVTSMTIPGEGTWTVDPTTGAITFTPQVGFNGNPTVQQYNVEDNAGVVSNNSNLTITYVAPITISGTIFNDANGNTLIDGIETGTTAGTNLYVYLVNAAGIIVDSAKVLPNGTYTLDAGQDLDYTIELSTIQYPIGTNVSTTPIINNPPAGWITTGENGTANTGSGDGTPDGALFIHTPITNVSNQNFGITKAGYIYVQKKALDETSSIDFPFTITGGSTLVPNFNLNDKDDQIAVQDLGASEYGRLWAVGTNHILYYRDLGNSMWVATTVTDAYRVDGGQGNDCYYINTLSDPYSFINGTKTLLGNWPSHGGSPAKDIGSSWDNKPYIVTNAGTIWQYSGSGTVWAQLNATTNNNRIDGNPANGNAIVSKTDNNIYSISSAGVTTSLGKPTNSINAAQDIAVTSDGSIFASYMSSTLFNGYAFKWISGTAWTTEELTSRNYANTIMTAGLGGQVWGGYSLNTTSTVNLNIFTRTFDGSTALWLNDERVRTTVTGNTEMIAVIPGTYSITEQVPGGWDLQHLNVYDPSTNSTASLTGNTATLVVAPGETVTSVFENGLVNPFLMTNNCSASYIENFGTGAVGTYGLPLVGQTSYHYQTTGNTFSNNYKIVGNSNEIFTGANSLFDHTEGNGQGRMFLVDANNENDAFFRRRFTGVIPGATYNFSAWIANVNAIAPIKPNVSFEVIDPTTYAILQSVNTGNIVADRVWTNYGVTFTATTSTFDLVIRNNGIGGSGNDLAIDDISFSLTSSGNPITTVTNSGCSSLGSINVTSPVGSSFEYSKDGAIWQDSPAFLNLLPGFYTTYTRSKATVGCVTSKTDTVKASICGNVFNDPNGLIDNTVNGTGTNIGGALIAVIYDNTTGKVVDTAYVTASGTYTLHAETGDNYTVYLTTTPAMIGQVTKPIVTLPSGWVNTGEIFGTGTGSNTPIDGILSIGTLTATVNNVNFGIEQPPVAIADQSLNNVTGVPVTINPLTNDTDAAPGTLDPTTVSLVAPTGATGVVTDAHGDVTSMTIPGEGTWTVDPTTGGITFTPQVGFTGNPTVQQYNVEDNAGVVSNNADLTITYVAPITITGTVINDANGNTLIDGTETGTTAGTNLYVYLVDASGIVIDSAKVLPNGTYTLDGGQNATYTIELSTIQYPIGTNTLTIPIVNTPPSGWVTTGENGNNNTGTGDGTPNGTLSVTTGTTNVTNQNFAIEQPPVAASDQSLNNVTGTPVTINPLTNDTDAAPGTLDPTTVSLVAPTGATGVVTDAHGDITSMTIPGEGTWTVDPTTGVITFTPQVGFTGNPTVQQYNVEDNAGVVSNNANITITYVTPITITGTVINDANGNTLIDGTETGTTAGTNLYIYLVNAAGIVVDSAQVLPNGRYTLDGGQNSTYTIELSTIQYPVGTDANTTSIVTAPPTGWVATGENGNNNTGSGDGTPNGTLPVTTGTTNVTDQNFAIEQPPVVPNQNYVALTPFVNSFITLNGTGTINSPGPLKGTDTEDGSLGIGNTFNITSLAGMNGNTLIYNNILITGPITINNYDPSLLQIQFTGIGSTQLSFGYSAIDAASVQGVAGTYTVNWAGAGPLPVKLVSFNANIYGDAANLTWTVEQEVGVKNYEILFSVDGVNFKSIGSVTATNSSSYNFEFISWAIGNNYYRIKTNDKDGKAIYSVIRMVRVDKNGSILVYPNPVKNQVNIFLSDSWIKKQLTIEISNPLGQIVLTKQIKNAQQTERVEVNNLPNGIYSLKLTQENNIIESKKIQIVN